MEDRHQGVEHFGGHILVDVLVLLEAHSLALQSVGQLLEAVGRHGAVLTIS